jgi:hypothetical protein
MVTFASTILRQGLDPVFHVTLLGAAAHAQQASTPAQPPTGALTYQRLAISVHNPFEDFVKVPIQSTTRFQVTHNRNAGDSVNAEPLVPFSLNADWDLIARPSPTVTYYPVRMSSSDSMTCSFLFLTPANATTWIWNVGPIFQFRTATSKELRTDRWSAGPTAALVYAVGAWFRAILAYQLMSLAGNRDRASVNRTYIEPEAATTLRAVGTSTAIPNDLRLDSRYRQCLAHRDGRRYRQGVHISSQSLNLQIVAYDLLKG